MLELNSILTVVAKFVLTERTFPVVTAHAADGMLRVKYVALVKWAGRFMVEKRLLVLLLPSDFVELRALVWLWSWVQHTVS